MFRDPQKTSVTFRIRPTQDLRAPRDAFRFRRKMEQRKAPAKELQPLGEGPLLAGRFGAPHPTPCSCADCLNWWTQQDTDQSFINSASALCEQR